MRELESRLCLDLCRVRVRVRVGVRVGLGLGENCNVSDTEIELGDNACDFEKVPPDQLYPSAERG